MLLIVLVSKSYLSLVSQNCVCVPKILSVSCFYDIVILIMLQIKTVKNVHKAREQSIQCVKQLQHLKEKKLDSVMKQIFF